MSGNKKLKVGIISLGCPRNLVDSENILGRLTLKGFPIVDMEKADVGIVNTCAFIDDAKKETIDTILDLLSLKKEGKLKKVIVYGCLVERYKYELQKELPEVDAFVGRISLPLEQKDFSLTAPHYAYLKICEGCINRCSYCVIPRIKGKFTSVPMEAVLEKAKAFDGRGVAELNIIGQDITGYGLDVYGDYRLTRIVARILEETSRIHWIRLLYLNPERITDELLRMIASEARICKYIDVPLQHSNDRILRLMNRKVTKRAIIALIEKIRKLHPHIALRTAFIVGFPSETDNEFKELLSFIKEMRFERLGVFTYSREEGTQAYRLPGQVPLKIKQERFNAVMQLQQDISRAYNAHFQGKDLEVMIDNEEHGVYLGRTQYDAPEVDGMVYVRSKKPLSPGTFVKVRITDTLEYDLVGESV